MYKPSDTQVLVNHNIYMHKPSDTQVLVNRDNDMYKPSDTQVLVNRDNDMYKPSDIHLLVNRDDEMYKPSTTKLLYKCSSTDVNCYHNSHLNMYQNNSMEYITNEHHIFVFSVRCQQIPRQCAQNV